MFALAKSSGARRGPRTSPKHRHKQTPGCNLPQREIKYLGGVKTTSSLPVCTSFFTFLSLCLVVLVFPASLCSVFACAGCVQYNNPRVVETLRVFCSVVSDIVTGRAFIHALHSLLLQVLFRITGCCVIAKKNSPIHGYYVRACSFPLLFEEKLCYVDPG